jgi:RNA recognition motif-containing protein
MNDSSQQANPKKLFIGNLSYNVTEDELRGSFSQFGEITDLKLITDRMSGRSKGIAFVTYATEEAAQAAIEGMHNQEIDGRAVIVNVARPQVPRENRPGGGFGGGSRGGFGGGGGSRGGFGGGDRRGGSDRRNSY